VLFDVLLDRTSDHTVTFFESNRWRLYDKSLRDLTGSLVGDLNDGTVVDSGMSEEECFKLGGSDLVSLISVSFA